MFRESQFPAQVTQLVSSRDQPQVGRSPYTLMPAVDLVLPLTLGDGRTGPGSRGLSPISEGPTHPQHVTPTPQDGIHRAEWASLGDTLTRSSLQM